MSRMRVIEVRTVREAKEVISNWMLMGNYATIEDLVDHVEFRGLTLGEANHAVALYKLDAAKFEQDKKSIESQIDKLHQTILKNRKSLDDELEEMKRAHERRMRDLI